MVQLISSLFPKRDSEIIDKQTFAAPGAFTWTKPANVLPTDTVIIDLWGGGGSGGIFYDTNAVCGPPGGGGAHNRLILSAADLNETESGIVAAGASAATNTGVASSLNGSAGGYSQFKNARAYGGGGGSGTSLSNGGYGGSGGGTLSTGLTAGSYRGGEPQVLAPANINMTESTNYRWAPGEWGGGPAIISNNPPTNYQFATIHGGAGGITGTDRYLRSSIWGVLREVLTEIVVRQELN